MLFINTPSSFEKSVARISESSFFLYVHQGLMKSSSTTAASEFSPDDTVL